jgi:hypothetical protein
VVHDEGLPAQTGTAVTFDPDEAPTPPSANDGSAAVVFRLFSGLCDLDRRRLSRLVEAWFVADTDQRILIEEVAFALVKHSKPPPRPPR